MNWNFFKRLVYFLLSSNLIKRGECYCGNSFDNYGPSTNSKPCDLPCAGDSDQRCGGDAANNVFLADITYQCYYIQTSLYNIALNYKK